MPTHFTKHKTDIEEEKNDSIFKFRDRVFYTFHHLLLFKDISARFGSILLGIHYLQIIVLTFNNDNIYVSQSIISYIVQYLKYLLIFPLVIEQASRSLYLTFFIICCLLIAFLIIIGILFTGVKDFENIRIQNTAYYIGVIYEFSSKVLFLPVIGILFYSFNCKSNLFSQCFGADQIVVCSISAIFIVLFIAFQYFVEEFFFVFAFKTKDCFSRTPSSMNVVALTHKVFSILITIFIFEGVYSPIYGLYHILLGGLLLDNFLTKLPFFNSIIARNYGICISVYVWVNFCLILVEVIALGLIRSNILVLVGVGIVFFCSLINNTRSLLLKSLTIKDANEITNDIYLDSKVRLFFKLAKESESDSTAELLLASLMRIHADKCIDLKCPCKDRMGLYDPKKVSYSNSTLILHKDFTFIKHFIFHIIKTGSSKYMDSKLLTLDLVYFLFEAMRNYPWVYVQLAVFKKKLLDDRSSIIDFLIYRLEFFLKTFLKVKNGKAISSKLKFEKLTLYDKNVSLLRRRIKKVIDNFIGIWDIIGGQVPDLQQLNNNLAINLRTIKKVKDVYKKILVLNSHSIEVKIIMEIYANYIVYDEIFFAQLQDDIILKPSMEIGNSENLDRKILLKTWDMYDKNSFTIEISSQHEKIGSITSYSRNTPKLLGYNEKELDFQNINMIIPKLLAKPHVEALKTFFETANDKFLGPPNHLFAIHKTGYVFSMNIIAKVVPTFDSFRMIGLIHVLNQDDYILMDEKGEIDSIGKEVHKLTGIGHEWPKNMIINFQVMAPKLIEFFQDFWTISKIDKNNSNKNGDIVFMNQINQSGKDDNRLRKFCIYVPKNLQKWLQKFYEDVRDLQKQHENNISLLVKNGQGLTSKKAIDKNIKEIYKVHLEFREQYGKKIYQTIRKLAIEDLEKVIKVKASLLTSSLYRGQVRLKVIKIHSYSIRDYSYLTKTKRLRQEKHLKLLDKFFIRVSRKINANENESSDEVDTYDKQEEKIGGDLFVQDGDEADKQRRKDLLPFFNKNSNNDDSFSKKNSKLAIVSSSKLTMTGDKTDDFLENRKKGNKFTNILVLLQKQRILTKTSLAAPLMTENSNESAKKDFISVFKQLKSKETISDPELGMKPGPKMNSFNLASNRFSALKSFLKSPKRKSKKHRSGFEYAILEQYENISLIKPAIAQSIQEDENQIAEWVKVKLKKKVQVVRTAIEESEMEKKGKKKKITDIMNTSSSGDTMRSDKKENSDRKSIATFNSWHNKDHIETKLKRRKDELKEQLRGKNIQREQAASISSSSSSLLGFKNISKYLKESLENQKIPIILRLSNWIIYLLIMLIIGGSFGNFVLLTNEYQNLTQNVISLKTPSDYGFNLLLAFDDYLDFQLINSEIINSSIYDHNWFNHENNVLTNISNELKGQLNYALSPKNASSFNSNLLYQISGFQIVIEDTPVTIDLNYEKFISLIINAINQTNDLTIDQLNNTNNEFIFILRNNFDPITSLIDSSISSVNSDVMAQTDKLYQRVVLDLLLNVVCIFIGFLLIFPVNMKARVAIEYILVLFTKLSKRDTEFYLRHYKLMRLSWNSSGENENRLQREVNEDLRIEALSREALKEMSSVGRTKMYKGMRASYFAFLIGSLTTLSLFVVMISLRSIPLLIGIGQYRNFAAIYMNICTIPYDYIEIYEGYKSILANSIINGTNYNDAYFAKVDGWIKKYYQKYEIPDNLYNTKIAAISDRTLYFTQIFMFGDICLNLPTVSSNSNSPQCEALLFETLTQGFRGFDDLSKQYFRLNFDIIHDNYIAYNPSNQGMIYNTSISGLNDKFLKDFRDSWVLIKNVYDYWLGLIEGDLEELQKSHIESTRNIMIAYFLLLIMFLIIVWRLQYDRLERNIKQTNEYFTLLPNNLLRENQFIKLYLQRTLNVKALNYS